MGKPWEAVSMGEGATIGNLLLVLAVLCGVIGTLVLKSVLKRGGAYQVAFLYLLFGILPTTIFALKYIPTLSIDSVGQNGFLAITYNILAVTIANRLFMYSLKRKKAQDAGIFSDIHPIVTVIAAWLFFLRYPTKGSFLAQC